MGSIIFLTPSPFRLIELRGKVWEGMYWLAQLRSEVGGKSKKCTRENKKKDPIRAVGPNLVVDTPLRDMRSTCEQGILKLS